MTPTPDSDAATTYAELAPQATDGTINEADAERFVATLQGSWGPEQSIPWASHLLTAHPEWHGVRMAMGQIMQASGDASGAAQVAYAYERRPSLVMGDAPGAPGTPDANPLVSSGLVSSDELVSGGVGGPTSRGGRIMMGLLMSTGGLRPAGSRRRHRYGNDFNDPYDRYDDNALRFNLSSLIPQKYRVAAMLVMLVLIGGMYFMFHNKTAAATKTVQTQTPAMTQSQQPATTAPPAGADQAAQPAP